MWIPNWSVDWLVRKMGEYELEVSDDCTVVLREKGMNVNRISSRFNIITSERTAISISISRGYSIKHTWLECKSFLPSNLLV